MKPAEAYILNQEEPFKSILLQLQLLIETKFPSVEMRYKWKIPVYYLNDQHLCYLNCSVKKGYVDVGFWAKDHLENYNEFLVTEGRTVVKSLRYFSVEEIDAKILLSVVEEAYHKKHKGFYKK
ncbi:DUF1801 domain-containing protein [Tenacibaculum sp. IB213877]|uniref:DUF1801 domain-containing protein n=1 Tax=Tenacibaculum sp. IB213877 TaxID=3097351 RepID=UPI002A5AEC55|nr:DUF1801 domain-containing protein [Tenacibaculum sp. IB213877]MDY0780113.1 DUF1801 domain-containing protein [Tenacibaculum sp. IB213877]